MNSRSFRGPGLPTIESTTLPPWNLSSVGSLRTLYLVGTAWFSSTLSLTIFTRPERSSWIFSRCGTMALHGAHQVAQKSTMTGVDELITSVSKLASVVLLRVSDMRTCWLRERGLRLSDGARAWAR